MAQVNMEKVISAYRDFSQFYVNSHTLFYFTEPNLDGVNSGGGHSDMFISAARRAINEGYRIRMQNEQDTQNQRYPLHPDDVAKLRRAFNAEHFV